MVKPLNDLKQVPKQWHEKFDQVWLSNGYMINDLDKCICSKSINTYVFLIICLYIDDMLILSSNVGTINEIKEMLESNFDMKDMMEANVILSIKTIKVCDGLMLSQEYYVEKLLTRFKYYDCKTMFLPRMMIIPT